MNKYNKYIYFWLLIILHSCSNSPSKTKPATMNGDSSHKDFVKPTANNSDTLIVDKPAAVFYYPDSMQLKKIEGVIQNRILESLLHEYFYQIRNAHIVLQRNQPAIKIIEAKNVRYLFFKKNNSASICIDLDKKNDIYGLFLFDTKKDPLSIDMMNIDTELGFYFRE